MVSILTTLKLKGPNSDFYTTLDRMKCQRHDNLPSVKNFCQFDSRLPVFDLDKV